MSQLTIPAPGLAFASVLFHSAHHTQEQLVAILENYWGQGEVYLPEFNPLLDYYSLEMGDKTQLRRLLFFSHRLFAREELVEWKLWATALEQQHQKTGKRTLNLDPGLITLENFGLATGKNFIHRTYLGQGVFFDLNFIFQNKTFVPLPWTYPDYAHPEKLNLLLKARRHLHQALSSLS